MARAFRAVLLLASMGCAMAQVKFVEVDPGHFHAALVLKEMYPEVSPQVTVYAPLGPELVDYLNRVSLFKLDWRLDIHTGPDFFERMLRERPGNVAVFAGKNRPKIGRIARSLEAGYNVLADKPWIIASEDMPQLAAALDLAEKKGLVAYDVMTERYEITSILQKELVNAPEVFGRLESVAATSTHQLMKTVAGVPLRRPAWFFNIEEAGEGIADVGTHVVDLIEWTAFPRIEVDYRTDVRVLGARRWPTVLDRAQFRQVTGEADFPAFLAKWVKDGRFEYFSNNSVSYTVKGVPVEVETLWNWEAPPGGGDVYEAAFRGALSRVEIRQTKDTKWRPELYVAPNAASRDAVFAALRKKLDALQAAWPGVDMAVEGAEARIVIPEKYRVGHEAHFAQVTRAFLGYLKDPKSLPAWEKGNMLVKYFVCTKAVELSRGR